MPSEEAIRLKEAGTAAYSKKDFRMAISQFSSSIDACKDATSTEDKEFLKLLLSNRSAAYQNVKEYDAALSDANRCISIDPQWPKGYGRKGDALLSLNRNGEAFNAYNTGLRLNPSDQTLVQKSELAMRKIRGESQESAAFENSTSANGSNNRISLYLHYATLGCFIAYCIPISFYNIIFGRLSAAAFAGINLLSLFQRHGFPRFENDYGVRVMTDVVVTPLLLGLLVLFSPKMYLLPLLSISIFALRQFLHSMLEYGRKHARDLEEKIVPMMVRYVPSIAPALQSINILQLFDDRNIPQFRSLLNQIASQAMVMQGIFLLVELLLPTRNIIQCYLWWQFLKMIYMHETSRSSADERHVQLAFTELDRNITSLLAYPMVPQVVRTGYQTVKTYLHKQVQLPDRNAARAASTGSSGLSGMLSRCVIM
mmetsp:Transcript_43053/g.31431  ORF Transcript_43053/g.31431 Transcript_43053/m.31431 type:complete len:426 (+) Transcript_43053:31-1308(+)|eukprot:CAMPEP_0202972286 /NCGR_PEP_ID=MMETSP1396-20130829/35082_1 /ASSEMBLY_ACC=CAM_ASM_000872 /TAXON_ID= /ORGANISM="Pseudokeronopsis sp., Strain Brazil" /LENGTH=425 /DNA_ID=CAMNT_0049702535 /DNA_START=29 /DNA_END=1306 /DNA_ORIENTATION=+